MEKLTNKITGWIQNYAINAKKRSLILGMSGGIDSAVVAVLCNLTRFDIICISMPMRDDNSPSSIRAKDMCDKIKCKFIFQPIGNIVDAYMDGYMVTDLGGRSISEDKFRIGNLSARVRANILYDAAFANNGLVIGTCNKDEKTWIKLECPKKHICFDTWIYSKDSFLTKKKHFFAHGWKKK